MWLKGLYYTGIAVMLSGIFMPKTSVSWLPVQLDTLAMLVGGVVSIACQIILDVRERREFASTHVRCQHCENGWISK